MTNTLTAVFEPCEEGGFHAYFRELPSVHTQGETVPEASHNLVDAFYQVLSYQLEAELKEKENADKIEVTVQL
jgi:predicted RNase H-like HicB family nuclease